MPSSPLPERHISLPGTFNLRDVGGYPASGGTTRWRTLLRSTGCAGSMTPGARRWPR